MEPIKRNIGKLLNILLNFLHFQRNHRQVADGFQGCRLRRNPRFGHLSGGEKRESHQTRSLLPGRAEENHVVIREEQCGGFSEVL